MRYVLVLLVGLCLPLFAHAASLPAHPDKLVVTDLKVGTGVVAEPGLQVKVLYSVWFYDPSKPDGRGKKFDGTSDGEPFAFTMADPRLIEGWRQGMAGMRVGGHRTFIVPSDLAYGAKGRGIVPPNMPLVFDIELLDAQAAAKP